MSDSTFTNIDDHHLKQLGFDPQRLARVRASVVNDIEQGLCHGVNLMVSRHGKPVLTISEGYADKDAGRKLSLNDVFAHMSVAKQFTNILVLTLVERGLLKLHAPLAELIPGFGAFGKEQVNLFHLLTQISGVTGAIPMVPPEVLMNIEQLVKWAREQPLESQPGERVNYSAMVAHSLMAAACLAVDGRGRSYAQMLEEDLFRPLGMNDTSTSFQ